MTLINARPKRATAHSTGQHPGATKKPLGRLIIAFLLLSITLGVAISYVTRYAQSFTQITEAENKVMKQRRATDHLLTQLLNASTQAETLSMLYADDAELKRYMQAMKQVEKAITELKKLVTDPQQKARVDSLQYFVDLRREGMINLITALRHENNKGSNLQRQIANLHNNQRAVNLKVGVPVVERGEQVVIERRKRGFFRRLGDAFKRAKDDTVRTQLTQNERVSDTTQTQVNIADTLAEVLTGVHKSLQRDSLAQAKRLYRKSDQLRATSAELSQRMALLVDNINTAQQQHIAQVSHREQQHRSAAARKLSNLAICAVVLSALLMMWLWRDIRRSNRYRRTLERVMLQRERLLLTISHDIKAPVNSILGYLNLLPPSTVQQSKELCAIATSAHYLLHLVKALVEYYKLENGDVSIHAQPTNMHNLLNEVATIFKPLAEQKGLQFVCTNKHPQEVFINTDAFLLRQIIENLLSNAIKYTHTGKVSLTATWLPDNILSITVQDSGCGMTQADVERIFQPFTRVRGSEGQEGAGLGLSITQKLVKLLDGNLTVHSELDKGSQFTFEMPATLSTRDDVADIETEAEAEDEAEGKADAEGQMETATVTSPIQPFVHKAVSTTAQATHIAVLDDDALQMQLTEAILHNVLPAEVHIATFSQAEQLIAWIKQGNSPALVMTDIEMPSMTGYDVLTTLRHNHLLPNNVQVVAMTSHPLLPASHFKDCGFADVLFKPFTQPDLLRVFKNTWIINGEKNSYEDYSVNEPPISPQVQSISTSSHGAFDALLVFAEGDSQAQKAILQQFATDCQQHLTALQAACKARNKAEVCRIAHKMLPTFTLIQSTAVSALQTLESQRTNNFWQDNDEALCQQVTDELKQVLENIKHVLENIK